MIRKFLFPLEKGELFTCGWNNKGQLGLGHDEDWTELSKVVSLPRVSQVACGWNHTLAITGTTNAVQIHFRSCFICSNVFWNNFCYFFTKFCFSCFITVRITFTSVLHPQCILLYIHMICIICASHSLHIL